MATVQLNGTLRGAAGVKVVEVDAPADAIVADIIERLVAQMPLLTSEVLDADGNLRGNIAIFRNGRNIRLLDNLQTPVSPDQTLDLFPKIGAYRVFGG